jgi:hypothetical protein
MALNNMRGSLGASLTDAWVITAYAIANVIVILWRAGCHNSLDDEIILQFLLFLPLLPFYVR